MNEPPSLSLQVVNALKALEKEAFENGAVVKVQDMDYNLLSFEEQIKVDLQTDIMIGPHGAGERVKKGS